MKTAATVVMKIREGDAKMALFIAVKLSRWISVSVILVAVLSSGLAYGDEPKDRQVQRLVGELGDDRAAVRDEAEQRLLELAGDDAAANERFLEALPEPSERMPLAVQERLRRIRTAVELRAAKSAVAATHVTLQGTAMPLADVLTAIEKQTGNRFVDRREQFGGDAKPIDISTNFKDEPFWSAVDQLLDQALLNVYNYSGENALAVVAREEITAPRFGWADYSGPFRFEVIEVQSQRSFRDPERQSLRIQLEIAWEPRLRPIAISQPLNKITACDGQGNVIAPLSPDAVLDVEVREGSQATELVLPLALPPRSVEQIASLKGELIALVPGRRAVFRFGDLKNAAGKTQRNGGVQVTVDAVRKNNEIWEIHMRFRLDEDNQSLESHRGWVFQNVSYLVDEKGETIENAGFETTLQNDNEVGFAYFFDLPKEEKLDGLMWVYETPAAIVRLPVKYELKDVALP